MLAFDTLKLVRKLEAASFEHKQAADIAEALPEAMAIAELATKADSAAARAETKADIERLEAATKADSAAVRAEMKAMELHLVIIAGRSQSINVERFATAIFTNRCGRVSGGLFFRKATTRCATAAEMMPRCRAVSNSNCENVVTREQSRKQSRESASRRSMQTARRRAGVDRC